MCLSNRASMLKYENFLDWPLAEQCSSGKTGSWCYLIFSKPVKMELQLHRHARTNEWNKVVAVLNDAIGHFDRI